ncbi:MAG: sigma 54-interacting transcriptional regulator [Gammaproteobacteria bacterium]
MDEPRKPDLCLQLIIDSHSNPFVLVDENFTTVAANKAYRDSYATTDDKVAGHKYHRISHHFDTPRFINNEDCPLSKVMETNERYEVLHIHFDQQNQSEHVRIKGHPILGADGTRYVGEEIIRLAKAAELDCEEQKLIGRSAAFRHCIEGLSAAADSHVNILLLGESGVGKSLAASYIHHRSGRSGRAFITVDCRAINEALFESELFGHERGAFAGCVGRRRGLLDQADGGTLFLDEVGDLPLGLQGRLLNAIETGHFRRVGGRELLESNARIITATHYDLLAKIQENTFRSDLYYRLAGIVHKIPALRERTDDIPALADALLVRMRDPAAYHCHINEDARSILLKHDYPGNIRELRNTLQRAVSLCTDGHIRAEHIKFDERPATRTSPASDNARSLKQIESEQIAIMLEKYHGHRRRVAEELGISERTLYRKLKKYQLTGFGKCLRSDR